MNDKQKFTILVVDDMPENIELLVEILQPLYRVRVARNGRRALSLAAGNDKPDLILLDVMMPEMDGHEVCRALKDNPVTRRIPVIFVTARTDVDDETAGFHCGAVDYITKPISPPTVKARVRTHLMLSQTKIVLEQAVRRRTEQLRQINVQLENEVRRREDAINRAEHLSQFDALTGLPNRRQLQERLRRELERARQGPRCFCLVRINFDRMQAVNNSFGPSFGDAALALGARRLQNAMAPNDFIARDEGDSFIAILHRGWELPDQARDQSRSLIEKMLSELDRPLNLGDHQTTLTACAGVVVYPQDAQSLEKLLARAQMATSTAKSLGRGKIAYYTKRSGEDAASRYSLESELRDALRNDDLEIHFQPQIDLIRQRMTGAEALVRWPDGEGGYISNSKFIPIAEDTGMIIQLDHYVLRSLCDQALIWSHDLPADFRLGFNFSSVGFQDPHCAEQIIETISARGLPPGRFELEVTEQAVMTDFSDAIAKLIKLREFGIAIALDDFGTGYSSLAYLQRMPLDRLKIDRIFIREIETNAKSASIAQAIIQLARTLGLDCLVEGVETAAQLEFCRQHGGHHAQGFYLHRPMPPDDLMRLIEAEQPSRRTQPQSSA